MRFSEAVVALSIFAPGALAKLPKIPVPLAAAVDSSNLANEAHFQQLIDHNNPSLGTFSQRYWYNAEYWQGEGSPVVLFTPGEIEAAAYTIYLTNQSITGLYAEAIGGAAILLEHRYWGTSSPYQDLTAETLQYLTLEQAIADLTYFAKTVDLPFDTNYSSNADKAPWVLAGGSYSGALAAWTESTAPGTFWAYSASSAPVEAVYNYWRYFVPVQEGMPTNCSRDVNLVMEHIDFVRFSGDIERQRELKKMFGLEALEHFDDFTDAIENGPWLWQENTFYTGYSEFFQFCDAVENVEAGAAKTPGPEGVGLQKALEGYAKWFKNSYLPGACKAYGYWEDENSVECFDTYNASSPMFTDISPQNTFDRTWLWFCCNEPFFYWQTAAPWYHPTLVSRTIDPEYDQRQCSLFFPETNGYTYSSARGKNAMDVNRWTGGWSNKERTRLLFTNGQFDPWREAGVSSSARPGGPMQSTSRTPVYMVPGGFHTTDMLALNGELNPGTQNVINEEVAQIKQWVGEFYHH